MKLSTKLASMLAYEPSTPASFRHWPNLNRSSEWHDARDESNAAQSKARRVELTVVGSPSHVQFRAIDQLARRLNAASSSFADRRISVTLVVASPAAFALIDSDDRVVRGIVRKALAGLQARRSAVQSDSTSATAKADEADRQTPVCQQVLTPPLSRSALRRENS